MQLPTKKQLIDAMPLIAIIIIFIGLFIPVDIPLHGYIGLALGAAGATLFPFYREWKLSSETLKFGLEYLIPIVIAVLIAVVGVEYQELYQWILIETAGWPTFMGAVVYIVGIMVGYGGKAMFIGFKNNIPFLGELRLLIAELIEPVDSTIPNSDDDVTVTEEKEPPDISSGRSDSQPSMI